MDSSEDLLQNVYAYFLKAYRQGAPGTAQDELVAFESIGFSPGCSALTGNNVVAAALEEVSHFTDELPEVVGGVYTHTLRTISFTYGGMLDAAEPSSAASLVTFTDFKSRAQKAYQGTIGSFDGPTPYLPTYPTPVDWYDLSNAANWQSYSYDASAKAPAPAPVAPNVRMQWRIVPQEMRPLILQQRNQEGPPAPGGVRHPMFMRETMVSNQAAGVRAAEPAAQVMPMRARMVSNQAIATHVVEPAAASPQLSPVTSIKEVRFTGLRSVASIATQTQSQPVETPKFTMSFDYCLVRLRRPWLSGDLLATPGWYVPGAHGGDYASGPPANTGAFAVIPTAFIAVKNLVIDANWSDSDVAARANAAAFGPFSLLGPPTDDKNSVRNPGIQVIAWICSVQPQLPPDTDPSLIKAAATPPVTVPTSSGSGSTTQPPSGSSDPTAGSGAAGNTTGAAATGSGTGTSGTSAAAANSDTPGGSSGSQGSAPG